MHKKKSIKGINGFVYIGTIGSCIWVDRPEYRCCMLYVGHPHRTEQKWRLLSWYTYSHRVEILHYSHDNRKVLLNGSCFFYSCDQLKKKKKTNYFSLGIQSARTRWSNKCAINMPSRQLNIPIRSIATPPLIQSIIPTLRIHFAYWQFTSNAMLYENDNDAMILVWCKQYMFPI